VSRVLAVDGGNTKTLAAVADAEGRTLGLGRAGRADIYNAASPEEAIEAVAAAVDEALSAASATAGELEAAVFSLAGADWPEDFVLLERSLRERLGLVVAPLVVNDAIGALRGGSPDWSGISVVSGTYNAVGARRADGAVFHLGFWPDGAGGRDLGRAGLRAVYYADLGITPPTALTARALELFGASDAIDLLHAFTRRGGLPEQEGDRLAPVLLDVADEGDAVAQAIVEQMGRVLGSQARACAAKIDLELAGARVVLAGGVFGHPTERLAAATMAELPGAEAVRFLAPPLTGSLLLALDGIGVHADGAAVAAGLPVPVPDGRSAAWAGSPSKA
jgi:N-acetylglucosamine kinase-like BadF-type ATPase